MRILKNVNHKLLITENHKFKIDLKKWKMDNHVINH